MHKVRFETINKVDFMYYWNDDIKEEVEIYGRLNSNYAWEFCFGLTCIQDFVGNPVANAINYLMEVQFDYELQN